MLIQQIFEFQLSEPGPPGRTCTPTTDYFYEKNKYLTEKSSSKLLFTAKTLHEAMYLATWAKSLTKFIPKMQDCKRVLDLNF